MTYPIQNHFTEINIKYMKYDTYDTTYSYGIPWQQGIDKETVMMSVLANPKLIVVDEGEKCPPFNPDLAEIYADIKQRLKQANKQQTFCYSYKEVMEKIRKKNEHTTDI